MAGGEAGHVRSPDEGLAGDGGAAGIDADAHEEVPAVIEEGFEAVGGPSAAVGGGLHFLPDAAGEPIVAEREAQAGIGAAGGMAVSEAGEAVFGIPQGEEHRKLVVIDERDIERVTAAELTSRLQVFADGYRAAREEMAGKKPEKARQYEEERRSDINDID